MRHKVNKKKQVVKAKEDEVEQVKVKAKPKAPAQNKVKEKKKKNTLSRRQPRPRKCRGPLPDAKIKDVIDLVSSDEENRNNGAESDNDSIKLVKIKNGRKIQSSSKSSAASTPTTNQLKLSTTGNKSNNASPAEKMQKLAVKRKLDFPSPSQETRDSQSTYSSVLETSLSSSSASNSSFSGHGIGIELDLVANQVNNGNENKNPTEKRRKLTAKRKIRLSTEGLKTLDSPSTYLSVLEASLSSGSSSANSSLSENGNGIESESELDACTNKSDIIEIEITSYDEISLASTPPSPSKPNTNHQIISKEIVDVNDDSQDSISLLFTTDDKSKSEKIIHQTAIDPDIIEIPGSSFDLSSSSSSISNINSPYASARKDLSINYSFTSNFLEEASTPLSRSSSSSSISTPSCTSFQAKDFISLTDSNSDDYESAKDSENDSFISTVPNTEEVRDDSTGTGEKETGFDLDLTDSNKSGPSKRLSESQEFEMLEEVLLNDLMENYEFDDETVKRMLEDTGLSNFDWDGLKLKLETITGKDLDSILKANEMETESDAEKVGEGVNSTNF